jgi:SAM-dependent methyltransferase
MASGALDDAEDRGYRIYSDLADWWPMISPLREYTREAAYLGDLLSQLTQTSPANSTSPAEVLDLGSGGGHVAVHLKEMFTMTLVDISDQMLTASRRLNPECDHQIGDMRTIRLGRRFDAVLVHDAIDYIIGTQDLRLVIQTAAAHCKPGGLALFVPDYIKDTFSELSGGGGGGVDAAGRTASFVERTWDPDPADDWVQADYEFILRTPGGAPQVVHESHRLSAFSRDTWLALLAKAGLTHEPEPDTDRQQNSASQRPANLFVTRAKSSCWSRAGKD